MIRAALDSNILVYLELEPESEKGARARHVLELAAPGGIAPVQALLEFAAVVRRRRPSSLSSALRKIDAIARTMATPATTPLDMQAALDAAARHQLQVWDAVIWAASRGAGADILLSEDMQNGFVLDGVRIVNPFALQPVELETLLTRP